MGFGTCVGGTDTYVSLLPEVREMTHFGRGGPFSQFPEDCWLLSNCQKLSIGPG